MGGGPAESVVEGDEPMESGAEKGGLVGSAAGDCSVRDAPLNVRLSKKSAGCELVLRTPHEAASAFLVYWDVMVAGMSGGVVVA